MIVPVLLMSWAVVAAAPQEVLLLPPMDEAGHMVPDDVVEVAAQTARESVHVPLAAGTAQVREVLLQMERENQRCRAEQLNCLANVGTLVDAPRVLVTTLRATTIDIELIDVATATLVRKRSAPGGSDTRDRAQQVRSAVSWVLVGDSAPAATTTPEPPRNASTAPTTSPAPATPVATEHGSSPLVLAGGIEIGVGAIAATWCGLVAADNEKTYEDATANVQKRKDALRDGPSWLLGATLGAGVAVVGVGVLVAGIVMSNP
jgi:hypothetical protein